MNTPKLSIILPTYNRAGFLPQAFESIHAQTFEDWELIVVDDGSTDDSRALIEEFIATSPQPVRYVYQENAGPYPARNTGLDLVRCEYVAFFDSDDYWFPHHLTDCVEALQHNPDVDWVFGATQVVNHATGDVLNPNHFYMNGVARPLLRLPCEERGPLRVIEDASVTTCAIRHNLRCGLQHSVIRRNVFEKTRFATHFHNEAEDQLAVARASKAGHRFAYLNNVHVTYRIHPENSCAGAENAGLDKLLEINRALVRGFEELPAQISLNRREMRALNGRIAEECFWHLGYPLLENGRYREARAMFRKGLRHSPLNLLYWKTYLLAVLRSVAFGTKE